MMTKQRQRSWARAAIALAAIYLLALQLVLPRTADASLSPVAADIICASGQSADGAEGRGERPSHSHQNFTDCCVLSGRFQLDGPVVVAGVVPALVAPDAAGGKAWSALRQGDTPPSRSIDPNRLRGPPADLV
jgi:hypothetical protein